MTSITSTPACLAVVRANDDEATAMEAVRRVREARGGDYVVLEDSNPAVQRMSLRSGVGLIPDCHVARVTLPDAEGAVGARGWKVSRLESFRANDA